MGAQAEIAIAAHDCHQGRGLLPYPVRREAIISGDLIFPNIYAPLVLWNEDGRHLVTSWWTEKLSRAASEAKPGHVWIHFTLKGVEQLIGAYSLIGAKAGIV